MRNKNLLFIVFAFLPFLLNAQNKPDIGEFGVGFKANKLGDLLFNFDSEVDENEPDDFGVLEFRYQASDFISLRLGFGFLYSSSKTNGVGTGSTTVSFYPGALYHLPGSEKVDPYVGAQIILANLTDGFSTTGFGLLTGFNWFFTKGLGVGMETGIELRSHKEGETKNTNFGTRPFLQTQIVYYFGK